MSGLYNEQVLEFFKSDLWNKPFMVEGLSRYYIFEPKSNLIYHIVSSSFYEQGFYKICKNIYNKKGQIVILTATGMDMAVINCRIRNHNKSISFAIFFFHWQENGTLVKCDTLPRCQQYTIKQTQTLDQTNLFL